MGITATRVAKNTGILYARMGITVFISLYTTRIILTTLGVTDFGIFNIIGGAIAMLGFLNAAMSGATQRFMSYATGERNIEKQRQIFTVSVILHLLIAVIFSMALLIAGYFFFKGILNIPEDRLLAARSIYYCMVASTVFTILAVPYDAVINANENMFYYAIIGVVEALLKLLIAFLVLYTSTDKLILYGILMACLSISLMAFMKFFCTRKYKECHFNFGKYYDRKLMSQMTKFAGWNLMGTASGMVSQYGLSIVLNSFWGTILNAAQGIANQISGQLMVFSNTMLKALNPVIAKSAGDGNRQLMLKAALSGARFSFFLLALFAIPFIIETPYLLSIWLKEVPDWAVLFTRLQIARFLVEQLTVPISGPISAMGDIRGYMILKSILNISPIIATYFLFANGFLPYWLYITWIAAGGLLGGAVILLFAKKKCGLMYVDFSRVVFFPAITMGLLLFVAGTLPQLFFEMQSFARLATVLVLTSSVFFLYFYFILITKQEKALLVNAFSFARQKLSIKRTGIT